MVQGQGAGERANAAQAALFLTDVAQFRATPALHAEMFGPAAVVVRTSGLDEMLALAEQLEGQLTATLQLSGTDHVDARRLLPVLERKAGRILVNGFPTGVEVSHAMVHGGPLPVHGQRHVHLGRRRGHRALSEARVLPGPAGRTAARSRYSKPTRWACGARWMANSQSNNIGS